MLTPLDENTERLVVRYLDGELDAAQVREVEALLHTNEAARRMFDDYRRIDADSRDVLSRILVPPMAAAAAERPRRGMWLATAAGVMAAAAAIGLFVFPAGPGGPAGADPSGGIAVTPQPVAPFPRVTPTPHNRAPLTTFASDEALSQPAAWNRMTPHRNVVDMQQQWIVVLDPRTQRSYLVRIDQADAASVPVRYDH